MKYLESIERIAREYPDRPAVKTSTGALLTYGGLWASSEALAAHLAGDDRLYGGAGAPVLVYGGKDPLMEVAFLACMKSGHPYVPIDCHSVPPERVASIADQVSCQLKASMGRDLECTAHDAGEVTEGAADPCPQTAADPLVLAIEPLPSVEGAPCVTVLERTQIEAVMCRDGHSDRARWIAGEDLAYILFTSGSTGAPKGVEVTADCFDKFCAWDLELARPVTRDAAPGAGVVWIDQAPFSFDLSVFELAGALAGGGTLFSLEHATQQSMALQLEALAASGASIWVSTPSFAEMCLANSEFCQDLLPALRLFLFCGETLPNATAARLLERFPLARVLNTYGPTESTVAVTQVEVTPEMARAAEPLPVGSPRPGTRIRIVREDGAECAAGERGEVVIEGDTVARGYYGRPDLTSRVFGTSELDGRAVRSYRTGDEGWLDAQGMLHFRGRLDLQVKLNGFRIELGEIEEHLRRLPQVAAAAVVPARRDDKISHLVAYVVADGPLVETPFRAGLALKDQLKSRLPHYMIPKKVAFVDELPMTGNGKVDRKALVAQNAR